MDDMTYALLGLLIIFSLSSRKLIITKTLVCAVILVTFAFWYISDMFTGNGVNDAVFYHLLNSSEGVSVDDLLPKIKIAAIFIIIILLTIGICVLVKLKKIKPIPIKNSLLLFILTMVFTLSSHFSVNIFNATKESFFSKGNADNVKDEYISPAVNLNKKYNYVFIYAESLEQTFQNLDGENYLPNLSALAKNYANFTNIIQPMNRGFGWTMAGMVNTQCGLPLVMEQGNAGENLSDFLINANCIATWLSKQGYKTEFLRGSQKEFAGGDKFFSQHGWKRQDDLSYFIKNGIASPEQISSWGVHDDVLLNHAWAEFDRLSKKTQPFILSFLTVNTHSPDGLFLSACQDHVGSNVKLPMLSAVKCSDFLLSEFIEKISKSPAFDNTIIVIVSDHLMMKNDASELLNEDENSRRNNFIVIKKGLNHYKNDTTGTLMDVWPTILDISGSENKSLGFGRSLLSNEKSKYMKDYESGKTSDYLAFSSNLWGVRSLTDPMIQSENSIQIGNQKFSLPLYSAIEGNRLSSFWFEAFAKNVFKITKNGSPFFYANLCKNIGVDYNGVCAYVVSPDSITKLRITSNGIVSSNKIDAKNIFYNTDIKGLSSAPFFNDSGFSTTGKNNKFSSGINFLTPEKSSFKTDLSYQTCTGDIVDNVAVNKLISQEEFIVVASSDSVYCGSDNNYKDIDSMLGTSIFTQLLFRQQVIGIIKNGSAEFIKGLPVMPLDAFIDIKNEKLISICMAFDDC